MAPIAWFALLATSWMPLWADVDIEGIIKLVFFIVLVFGSALAKIVSSIFQANNKAKGRRVVPPGAAGPPPAAANDPLRQEVGDLLRRFGVEIEEPPGARRDAVVAAEEAKGKGPAKAQPLPQRPMPPKTERPAARARSSDTARTAQPSRPARKPRPVPQPRDAAPADLAPAELAEDGDQLEHRDGRPVRLRGQGVAEHVQQHLDTSRTREHAESLGERIRSADQQRAARLHEKFDHALTTLDDDQARADAMSEMTDSGLVERVPGSNLVAERIRRMFSSPESARDAIILAEIFTPVHSRPETR